jgi:hypothetical protein
MIIDGCKKGRCVRIELPEIRSWYEKDENVLNADGVSHYGTQLAIIACLYKFVPAW